MLLFTYERTAIGVSRLVVCCYRSVMVGPPAPFAVMSGLLYAAASGKGFVLWAKRGESTSCDWQGNYVTGIYCSNGLPF